MKTIITLIFAGLLLNTALADEERIPLFPQLAIKTTQGSFIIELDGQRAPISTRNFVEYAQDKHYDGTVFHRVIAGFVAQAGGFGKDLKEKKTRQPIPNESGNGLSNVRGTVAFARTAHPHSATSQFYINLSDNRNLDPSPSRWGYSVFGRVVEGMEVLDNIASLPTGSKGPFEKDFPKFTVTIESVRLIEEQPPAAQ